MWLFKKGEKVPSALHITLCPVRPIEEVLSFEAQHSLGKDKFKGNFLLTSEQFGAMRSRAARLINNSDSKHLFFSPEEWEGLPQAFGSHFKPALFF